MLWTPNKPIFEEKNVPHKIGPWKFRYQGQIALFGPPGATFYSVDKMVKKKLSTCRQIIFIYIVDKNPLSTFLSGRKNGLKKSIYTQINNIYLHVNYLSTCKLFLRPKRVLKKGINWPLKEVVGLSSHSLLISTGLQRFPSHPIPTYIF